MNKHKTLLILLLLLINSQAIAQSSVSSFAFLSKCEKLSADNRLACTELVLFNYIKDKLNYPKQALENSIEGVVTVSFIITQDGKIVSVQCEKDIGNGCGEEAVQLIESINESELKWQAGSKDGESTSYQVLSYPIFFDIIPVNHTVPKIEMVFFKEKITPIRIGQRKRKTKKAITGRLLKVEEDTSLYFEADRLPIFPGCQNGGPFGDSLKADDCSTMALNSYIYKVLEYPIRPFSEGIEGIVQAKYTVEKNGIISNIKITKGIDAACNQAVVDAFESMNTRGIRWKPAIKNGQPVRLEQLMFIRFSITSEKERRAKSGF
jgi:TonB family protein